MPTEKYARNELLAHSLHRALEDGGIRALDNEVVPLTMDGGGCKMASTWWA